MSLADDKNKKILKEIKQNLNLEIGCRNPFEQILIYPNGEVMPCCPSYVDFYSFGNIFTDSFESIWSGKKATDFRKSILDGNFQNCHLDMCLSINHLKGDKIHDCKNEIEKNKIEYPKYVHLNIDSQCNVLCVTCRDKQDITSDEQIEKFEKITDEVIIPMLQNTTRISLDGAGELFASNIYPILLKKITKKYPHIKFDIITNGNLFDEKHCAGLGISDRINSVAFSIHANTQETYEKIVRGGNFKKVMENLKWAADMKKQNKINYVQMSFVVSALNYQEMVDFQKTADELEITANFWEYRPWGNARLDEKYQEMAIFDKQHKDYHKFVKVVSNKIFNNPNCIINSNLKPLNFSL